MVGAAYCGVAAFARMKSARSASATGRPSDWPCRTSQPWVEEKLRLCLRFDALGDDPDAEGRRHLNDGANDRGVFLVVREFLNELAIVFRVLTWNRLRYPRDE